MKGKKEGGGGEEVKEKEGGEEKVSKEGRGGKVSKEISKEELRRHRKEVRRRARIEKAKRFAKKVVKGLTSIVAILFFPALLVLIDRITKALALQPGCFLAFCLVKSKNYGLWLGLFSSLSERFAFRYLVFGISMLLLILLFLALFYVAKSRALKAAFTFIFAGIAGNLVDRVAYGYVVDWLAIKGLFSFNLADCYITLGVVLFLIGIVKRRKTAG
jgi:signal peptidase II